MTIDELLPRLQKVRKQGSGYVACCPGHNDNNPSLAIDSGHDGRILLKCWSGCSIEQITKGMGITIGDLMGDRKGHHLSPIIRPPQPTRKERVDALVLEIAQQQRERGERLSPADLQREREAFINTQRKRA